MRTTRIKSARRWAKRTNQVLVTANEFNYCFAHLFSILLNSVSKLLFCAFLSCGLVHLTITTISRGWALMLCCRNVSRIILLTQFRSADLGNVFLLAIIPSLAFSSSLWTKNILKYLSKIFSACMTWSKPFLRNNLCAIVNFEEILNSKSCAAPGATSPDNSSATTSLHANQKTMGTFSFGY
jgi:hypothetical protein